VVAEVRVKVVLPPIKEPRAGAGGRFKSHRPNGISAKLRVQLE
jgi:hypothetical protein